MLQHLKREVSTSCPFSPWCCAYAGCRRMTLLISLCCLRRSDVGPALPCIAFLVLVGVGVAWDLSVVRFRVYHVQRVEPWGLGTNGTWAEYSIG
ncbi:hypothetical protein KVT40_006102 [Elsinoe batatas]|uniref:Uncharacterized protein n=1 Tax=Elsinoe batatas TaxID=2601811 RepID=A0A8K0L128_9PEZI|nr:hypothetical protein KVT40_006102 [Elsinoe batatas]